MTQSGQIKLEIKHPQVSGPGSTKEFYSGSYNCWVVWMTVKRLWSTDYETNLLTGTDSGAEKNTDSGAKKHILYVFIE